MTDESVTNTSIYGLNGGGGVFSPSTSFLRRGSACGMGAGTGGGGRHAPLGSLVIAVGLGCAGSDSDGLIAGFGGFSGSVPGLSGISNNRISLDRGIGRPSHGNYHPYFNGGGSHYQQAQAPPQRTSAASTGLGPVSGMLLGPMGGHPVSGCIEESAEANVQAGPGGGAAGATARLQAAPQALLPASEPYIALYVAFREVLQVGGGAWWWGLLAGSALGHRATP